MSWPILVSCLFLFSATAHAQGEEVMSSMRLQMVHDQIEKRGVRDPRVLQAMRDVPRHEFVPDALQSAAYNDNPLPIGLGQTISQPYIVAFMTELLKVEKSHRVLEIGTGSGYQAAILSKLVAEVYSVEILEPLYKEARDRIGRLGISNVYLRVGDGWRGWPEEAPYDRIIVTAAAEKIPQDLIDQLKEGGRMVLPVGERPDQQMMKIGVKEGGAFKTHNTIPVRFVPLVHAKETA